MTDLLPYWLHSKTLRRIKNIFKLLLYSYILFACFHAFLLYLIIFENLSVNISVGLVLFTLKTKKTWLVNFINLPLNPSIHWKTLSWAGEGISVSIFRVSTVSNAIEPAFHNHQLIRTKSSDCNFFTPPKVYSLQYCHTFKLKDKLQKVWV